MPQLTSKTSSTSDLATACKDFRTTTLAAEGLDQEFAGLLLKTEMSLKIWDSPISFAIAAELEHSLQNSLDLCIKTAGLR